MAINKRCAFANCPIKVIKGYCDNHKAKAKERRGTASHRGYDHKWRIYRKHYLHQNPICVRCRDDLNIITPATLIDHIKPVVNGQHDSLFWVQSNHQALCRTCHSWKTRTIDLRGYGVVQGQK